MALSTGLITHVSIGAGHRKNRDYKKNVNILEAIKIVKNAGVKLIWIRWLWPGYDIAEDQAEDLFNPNYYIQEIQAIRAEAKEIGADFVCLDSEPYAQSPLKKYMKGKTRVNLDAEQLERLKKTIEQVIKRVGKIEFILPAGSFSIKHPHNIIAEIGRNRISEHTFYDNKKWLANIKYPYEISGAYLNSNKENPRRFDLPYFLPSEIFERSELWSHKKGVFLYPREGNSMA
ncbi:unnamed protein product, partial [marine sediment metagenome]